MSYPQNKACLKQQNNSVCHAIVEVAEQLLTLKPDDQDKTIVFVLQRLGTLLDFDRVYVFSFSDDLTRINYAHEWCAEGVEPQCPHARTMLADSLPWWKEKISQKKPVLIPCVNDLPSVALTEHEAFNLQDVQSVICLPLMDEDGRLMGCMRFDAMRSPCSWSEQDVDMLCLSAHLLAMTIGRCRAENELAESKALLDATASIARVGGWQIDAETKSVTWTQETFLIHEIPPPEIPPLDKAIEFFHPDDRGTLSRAIQQALDGGVPYDLEVRLITAKGHELWTRTICHPDVVNGKTVRLRGILQDVSARKRAEIAMRESNRRLKAFLEVTREMTACLEVDLLMQVIVDNISKAMNIDNGAIYLLTSDDTIQLAATTPPIPSGFPEKYRVANLIDHPHVAKAIRSGRSCMMADATTANLTPAEQEIVRLRSLRSNLYLPIRLKEQSIGVLILSSTTKPLILDDEDISFLQGFANHAAQVISNARNYEMINKHAVELQEHLVMRKQTEEAIRQNAELLERTQQMAHMGSWKLDVLVNRLFWSDEVYRIFGCAPQEFEATYEAFLGFVHPEDRAAVDEAYTRSVMDGRKGYEIEHRIVRKKTGEERFVHEQCVHEFNDAGNVIASMGMVHDITERKRMERYHVLCTDILKLLNQPVALEDTFQAILVAIRDSTGCASVGIRLASGEDFPYFVQNGFTNDFLLSENTLIARDSQGKVCRGPDGNVCLECTCGLVISGKTDPSNPQFSPGGSAWTNDSMPFLKVPAEEDPRLHPRNQCIHEGYASIALIPVRKREQIVGLLHLNHRKKNQFSDEVIRLLEGVAAHIGEALLRVQMEDEKEKLQAQVAQTQKMESVGRLAGGVAHDFNNMLMVILGGVECAMDEVGDNERLRNHLCDIQSAAKHSADLTRQLLAFARKQPITPKVLDVNHTIAGMLKMLRRLIGEDIKLMWRPGSDLYPVRMDPTQIDQILVNLCVNARDAISGKGMITVETENVSFDEAYCTKHSLPDHGEFVMLSVSDDGCGMDGSVRSQVFEPFFTTKKSGKGTGLGLATVFGTVHQNHGFINVYSEPELGTTFRIYFPRHASTS